MEDNFSTDGGGDDDSGSNASDGGQHMKLCLLACLLLTSCCVAQFLIGHGLVPVCGLGVGDPCFIPVA